MTGYLKGKGNTEIVAGLNTVLADTFRLYFKTHACHWNVEGPNFAALHTLFDNQYNELWSSIDTIAERIRVLKAFAPTSLTALANHSRLDESKKVLNAENMIKDLATDHEKMVETLISIIDLADEYDDTATENMLVERLTAHEKMIWMLRAHLK